MSGNNWKGSIELSARDAPMGIRRMFYVVWDIVTDLFVGVAVVGGATTSLQHLGSRMDGQVPSLVLSQDTCGVTASTA